MFNSFGIAEDYKTKHKCLVTAVNVHFYYKMHIEKHGLRQYGVYLHFKVLKCFAVSV